MVKTTAGAVRKLIREAIAVDPQLQPLVDAGMELISSERQLDNGTYMFHSPRTTSTFAIFTDPATGTVKRVEHANDDSHHSQATKIRHDGTLRGAAQAALGFAERKLERDARDNAGDAIEVSVSWGGKHLAVMNQLDQLVRAAEALGDNVTVSLDRDKQEKPGPTGTFNSDEIEDVLHDWVANSPNKFREGELYGSVNLVVPVGDGSIDDLRTKVARAFRPFSGTRGKAITCSVRPMAGGRRYGKGVR
jgi:hypothetical protein